MPGIFNSLNSIEDIIKFIGTFSPDTDSQARENTNMEYKEAHQKFSNTNEIGKDVSAFANRKGGLIFYGVKCDPSDPFTTLIKGLQKKIIPNHAPKVMLVYVPQSDESPHQNSDGKYYYAIGQ